MKFSGNPKRLIIQATALIITVMFITDMLVWFVYPGMNPVIFIIQAAIGIPLVFWILTQVIDKFIYQKIKVIYKNIHRLKRGKQPKSDMIDKPDVFESVNRDVMEWAEKQEQEILQLKANAKFRREFIGNLSHELKTPIFSIQGYVLTLLDGGLEDEQINRKYLKYTAKNIDRMIAMVKDLDVISALESGKMEPQIKPFNIEELAEEVKEMYEMAAAEKNINIFIVNKYDAPPMVLGDKDKIRHVFTNLVDNAIKYMSDRPEPFIKISFFDMYDNILIEVTDNGNGIPEKYLPRLFERFFRVDKARSRAQGGTGLGLSIVKHIIDAHNQTISVRSTVGVGTTFGFTLKKG
jgi:two-component system phosphate regulon sensor histidine kinase PhoR